jgi:tetratricopeptide (TPR) repeat protein
MPRTNNLPHPGGQARRPARRPTEGETEGTEMDYDKICFVIMPFGEKDVVDDKGRTRKVDFDPIYRDIFEPAIRLVPVPEGGTLVARRTDQDFFTGDIAQDMFEYLEYSRMALTDITGLNPNVLYELGVRHRARQSGTVTFRQPGVKLPFDINQIKAFPYEYEPREQAEQARALITRVLTESLQQNRLDSPVQKALRVQRESYSQIETQLKSAENAIRVGDRAKAITEYRAALRADPGNNLLHLRLGLLLKDEGQWPEALQQFDGAIAAAPDYAEAHREKGIAENKLYHKAGNPVDMPDGIASLARAVELNSQDFDAHASLGGALRRAGRLDEAIEHYERSADVSNGHSYPLLNAITLAAARDGKLQLDGKRRFQLKRAERSLRAQVATDPPYDAPWSFFDLAEIRLYDGDRPGFLELAERGTEFAKAGWQVNTFRETLQLLLDRGVALDGLPEGIEMLRERAGYLP